jgi:uncharacterized repeat protein (TIGR02543 family)/LPXTG-motif cell wall-anchored protein
MSIRRLVVVAVIAISVLLGSVRSIERTQPDIAHAAAGDGITAYISPPFVQGPPASTNATIQDFNGANFCLSLGASNVGTFSGNCTTVTSSLGDFKFGGANTTTDQPTVGGTASQFVAAWGSQVLTLSFDANNEARYLGFWWSAGSDGNQVKMYSKVGGNDVLTATFTTDALNAMLHTSNGTPPASVLPPNPYPGTSFVTAINGVQYNKGYYFGRPKDHTTLTPTALPLGYTNTDTHQNIYSHAYLNVYASGSVAFSKVEFIGPGFEFDNVAVSKQLRTPSSELVLLQSVLGKSVDFRANGGTGSMPAQTSDTASTLSPNTFTRTGHTFAGWSTSPTGTVEYADSASYAFGADLTLYAIWTANPPTPPAPTETETISNQIATTTTTPAVTTTTQIPAETTTTTTTTPANTVSEFGAKKQSQKLPETGRDSTPIIVVGFIALLAGLALRRRPRQRI